MGEKYSAPDGGQWRQSPPILVFGFILTSNIHTFNVWSSQENNIQNTRQCDINVAQQTYSNYNELLILN
jgi:hypothetical protein